MYVQAYSLSLPDLTFIIRQSM